LLDLWLESNGASWRPSTLAGYEDIVRLYLRPQFGRLLVRELTPAHVGQAYARWRAKGVGARTIAVCHLRLRRALRLACQLGVISRNPCDVVEAPRSEYKRPTLWTIDQTRSFIQSLSGEDWHGALFGVALGSGARAGELLGLRWEDLDLQAGTVRIQRTRGHLGADQIIEGPTKTEAGQRTVTLPPFSLTAVRVWRRAQAAQRLSAGPAWLGGDLVFTFPDGTGPTRCSLRYWLAKRARSLDLPVVTCHALRHISGSLALAAGATLPDVSKRLGHSNVATTASVYSHSLREDDVHVAAAITRALAL